ncbi:hypothetical protein PVL29_011317 [Vitis rotundifolia]|uniref:Uncharacterized protein n=1 Tax=Vitis rotundifolia TaxID=103349 RepID=A0AA38ZPU3_VITRO|nr:hypothetical protein PVL29_011317 [Vitis rotundifolia]
MEAGITPYSDHDHKSKGSELALWSARSTAPPPRLADFDYSKDIFENDTEVWTLGGFVRRCQCIPDLGSHHSDSAQRACSCFTAALTSCTVHPDSNTCLLLPCLLDIHLVNTHETNFWCSNQGPSSIEWYLWKVRRMQ